MQNPSSDNESPSKNRTAPGSLCLYLLHVSAGVALILLLPVVVMFFCERLLDVQMDATDRNLIHFMLFFFFFAYLAILGIDSPLQFLHAWRRQMEKRLTSAQEKGTGPTRDDSPR
jgi:hypothetical protein